MFRWPSAVMIWLACAPCMAMWWRRCRRPCRPIPSGSSASTRMRVQSFGEVHRPVAVRGREHKVVWLALRLAGDERLRRSRQADHARLAGFLAGLVRGRRQRDVPVLEVDMAPPHAGDFAASCAGERDDADGVGGRLPDALFRPPCGRASGKAAHRLARRRG